MPNKIDFYLLKEPPETYLRSVCLLVEKIYNLKQPLWIKTQNRSQTVALDDLLWTFHDTSFIPHESYITTAIIPKAPVIISDELDLKVSEKKDIVFINLSGKILPNWQTLPHILEAVANDDQERSKARERYKIYKAQDTQMTVMNTV